MGVKLLMKSTVVDESLSSMNQQFCSRENQLIQPPFRNFLKIIYTKLMKKKTTVYLPPAYVGR